MGDLISRKDVLKEFDILGKSTEKAVEEQVDSEKINFGNGVIHGISICYALVQERIATAYDIDKVRSILEENKEIIEDKEGVNHSVIPAFTADYIVRKDGWIKE